jgi:hypothetical protein
MSLDSSFGADTITRDTATGLDWLDLTETRGLSYYHVAGQMGAGQTYEGFRYATMAEFDQLVTNFGYVARNPSCPVGQFCDRQFAESDLVQQMILTLGDTLGPYYDSINFRYAVDPGGAGSTVGMLADPFLGYPNNTGAQVAALMDQQLIWRAFDQGVFNTLDSVYSSFGGESKSYYNRNMGSFLVSNVPHAVPTPATHWMIIAALAGLVGAMRRSRHAID